jgi:nucleoid-associated protein YgaU
MEITRALSVKADKYAPAELEEARKSLLGSHDLVAGDSLDAARDSAVTARKKAREAYEKSLPLLARDTIEVAEKSLSDADEANAALLGKEEYEQAQQLLKQANENFESRKYLEAHANALEADKMAKAARTASLGKQGILRDAIEEVKATLDEARGYKADEFAPEKTKAATENIKIASEALGALELKKGFAALEAAKVNADEAYLESLKRFAEETMIAAELLVAKAEKSEGAALARDEIEGARESMAGAKSSYSDARYRESIVSSNEASRLASLVLAAKKSGTVTGGDKPTGTPRETGEKKAAGEGGTAFKTHRVRYVPQQPECLWRIAARYYGNPRLWKRIFEANRDKIKDPNVIWPGMSLRIPVSNAGADGRREEKNADAAKEALPAKKSE